MKKERNTGKVTYTFEPGDTDKWYGKIVPDDSSCVAILRQPNVQIADGKIEVNIIGPFSGTNVPQAIEEFANERGIRIHS